MPSDKAEVPSGQQVEEYLRNKVGEDEVWSWLHSAYPGFGGAAEEGGEEEEEEEGEGVGKSKVDAEHQEAWKRRV